MANITPTSLSLQLFARAHGFIGNPVEFFNITEIYDSSEDNDF